MLKSCTLLQMPGGLACGYQVVDLVSICRVSTLSAHSVYLELELVTAAKAAGVQLFIPGEVCGSSPSWMFVEYSSDWNAAFSMASQ